MFAEGGGYEEEGEQEVMVGDVKDKEKEGN